MRCQWGARSGVWVLFNFFYTWNGVFWCILGDIFSVLSECNVTGNSWRYFGLFLPPVQLGRGKCQVPLAPSTATPAGYIIRGTVCTDATEGWALLLLVFESVPFQLPSRKKTWFWYGNQEFWCNISPMCYFLQVIAIDVSEIYYSLL